MKNSTYDKLKWVAQYLLPGLATLYFTLSKLWGLPYPAEITGTLSAVDVFLGGLLGISSMKYQQSLAEENGGAPNGDSSK